jgi:hypothetical protein
MDVADRIAVTYRGRITGILVESERLGEPWQAS